MLYSSHRPKIHPIRPSTLHGAISVSDVSFALYGASTTWSGSNSLLWAAGRAGRRARNRHPVRCASIAHLSLIDANSQMRLKAITFTTGGPPPARPASLTVKLSDWLCTSTSFCQKNFCSKMSVSPCQHRLCSWSRKSHARCECTPALPALLSIGADGGDLVPSTPGWRGGDPLHSYSWSSCVRCWWKLQYYNWVAFWWNTEDLTKN